MKKVLFFGPYPMPITGQSVAFKEIFDNYQGSKILCNVTYFGDKKILNLLYVYFIIPYLFLFKKIDVVYFTCSRSLIGFSRDFVLLLFTKIFKIKVINHLHGKDFKSFKETNFLVSKLVSWAYRDVEVSIVLLPSMSSEFIDFPNMTVNVVRNSFSKNIFDNDLKYKIENKFEKKQITISYLSNLMFSKGIFQFLDAIEFILEKYQNVNINIAGAVLSDYLLSASEVESRFLSKYDALKRNYSDRIKYFGVISGKEKCRFLEDSCIFILPTFHKTEAFPISIIEAMYYGNAIITTNHNFLPEIIKEENGYLVRKENVDDIVERIAYLVDNKNELYKMALLNHDLAIEEYSSDAYIDKLSIIINS